MSTETAQEYAYYRLNMGAALYEKPLRITEREARLYIGCARKNVDRAISLLQRGHEIRTTYAVFTAEPI